MRVGRCCSMPERQPVKDVLVVVPYEMAFKVEGMVRGAVGKESF